MEYEDACTPGTVSSDTAPHRSSSSCLTAWIAPASRPVPRLDRFATCSEYPGGAINASAVSILLVDDTLENLRLLSSMLTEQGYETRPVTSGHQALQAASLAPPDLILLDINMPEMNGYQLCARLKQMEQLRDVPVIFLTALSDTSDKIKAFEAGGVDYITKPFHLDEVLARVKAHVVLRRTRAELSRSYDRLQALEKLRDDLVHMVVHDLRSPLAVIVGSLELLQSGLGSTLDHQAAEDLSAAVDAAGVISAMTKDLLDVSRLEDGKMPIARTKTDLIKLARGVAVSLRAVDRTRMIEVVSDEPVELACDDRLMQRVLENLVNNAIKHTPAGGRICVSATRTGDRVRVAVHDEGPGVPPEARERIFEKFETLAARNARDYHSVGLGLAFCKLAIEAHGGTIGVEAGKLRGSVFWFEVPA
jgi:two-component system, sensor histidine kinase and response regulator